MPDPIKVRAFIDGQFHRGGETFVVEDKYLRIAIGEIETSTASNVELALNAAELAFRIGCADAGQALRDPVDRLAAACRTQEMHSPKLLIAEAGFTSADAATEVERAVLTLSLCADEASRIVGDTVAVRRSPGQEDRIGFTIRMAIGIVCAITPFNSPLNVVLHKIGPALAAGNAVILKPSGFTPLTAVMIAELLVTSRAAGRTDFGAS